MSRNRIHVVVIIVVVVVCILRQFFEIPAVGRLVTRTQHIVKPEVSLARNRKKGNNDNNNLLTSFSVAQSTYFPVIRRLVSYEFKCMSKEVLLTKFEVLWWQLPGGYEGNHGRPQYGQSVCGPSLDPVHSPVPSRRCETYEIEQASLNNLNSACTVV
jgi:hypothetical protein